ncbi:MAG: metallophosphoesterase family protein [Thermodesulfovibrionia bacterium]|nr:metallophosphoesterase family protein [Thermodesulfovibrionia bacterium]
MRICLFADIHGNGPAFRSAYPMLISEKADLNIFLGDLCGYYFDQSEIFEMLKDIPNLISIKGNHDQVFLKIVNGEEDCRRDYLKRYGRSMENLLYENNSALIQWLSDLPETFLSADPDIAGYHGSPQNNMDGYVYPDSPLDAFQYYMSSVFILGHTHYPMVRSIGAKLLINPGSLGQPRQGGWPSYAVFNYRSKEVMFKDVVYDRAELIKSIDDAGDNNPYLRQVLARHDNA